MSEPSYVTCRCQQCDGHIEFDINELAAENGIVPCPHCGLETMLSKCPKARALSNQATHETYIAHARSEPATEKQKAKLRYFGCTWDEGVTKGQAHDAIDECIRLFPEKEAEYYARPATEEQLARMREILKPGDEDPEDYAESDKPLTYGEAKCLLEDLELEERQKAEEEFWREIDGVRRQIDEDGPARKSAGSKEWFNKWDRPSEVEAKARARLAQKGLLNVEVVVGYAYGKIIINLDARTDNELAKAAKILNIA